MTTNVVYIDAYSPAGDGVTVDYAAMQNACTAAGVGGLVVLQGGGKKYYMGANQLVVPKGCTIFNPDIAGGNNGYDQVWFSSLGGIILDTSHPMFMQSRSALINCVVAPYGMTFPQSSAAGWAGVAITTNTGYNEVDILLRNTLVMGFFKAFDGYNCPRIRMEKFMMDCVNGLTINNAGDCIRLHDVHAWPFATVSGPNGNAGLVRSGIAFEFLANTDGGTVDNCFANDYQTSFHIADLNGLRLNNCGAEAPYISAPTGYMIDGNAQNIELNGCQGVAQQNAVVVNVTNPANMVSINGGMYAANNDNHVRVFNGTVALRNANMQNTGSAHTSLVGSGSKLIAQNNNYLGATPFNIMYNGAISSQLIAQNNIAL